MGLSKGSLHGTEQHPRVSNRGELLDHIGGGSFWNHLRAAVGEDYLIEAVLFVKGT